MATTQYPLRRKDSGRYRHTVNILRIPRDLDQTGQRTAPPLICWPEVPCEIETLTGRQLESARMLYPSADYRITMDYIEGVTPKHRLELLPKKRQFHIGYVQNTHEENVQLVLLCSEIL